MRIFFIISILLVSLTANSNYILDNSNGQVLGDKPYFDEGFVKSHRIKKIKGRISTKASLDIIRETDQEIIFEFDRFGNLIREYSTRDNDTLVTLYLYDSDGNITYIMKSNHVGFITEHYIYDKKGRVILKESKRETSKKKSAIEFERDESYEISSEKYEYIELENGAYKKLFYNKSGKVYKEEIVYLNKMNKIDHSETRMVIGSARKEVKYLYDNNDRISRIESESWIMGHSTMINKFEYDEEGRVMAKHFYKNDHYETEYQILYDNQTGYLHSILSRNAANDFITIIKFSVYNFYVN